MDAVQQVFVALLGRRGIVLEFDERYLKRAVRNECYSTLRRRRREIVEVVEGSLLEGVAGSPDRPDERLALERALRGIPPEQREVLHLKVTIYSLGANRRDDGGDVAPLKPAPPQRSIYPSGPDLGIRIPYR